MSQGSADEVVGAVRSKYGWQARAIAAVGRILMRRKDMRYGDTVVLVTPGAAAD